ncbi:hypothetical protein BMS3Abin12_00568 [bacterium BMS3Abin12]|nr:hypothetical protein BMS3Abin12_00568 [bacterium BMS3Abin12]
MRVLFLSLLLVNVAFFAWEYRHPEPPPAAVARLEPGVPSVRLLRERAAGAPTGKAMPAPAPGPGPAANVR